MLLLTLNEQEEKVIDKIIAAISDCIQLEAVQTIPVSTSGMSFPGLEIRRSQRRVIQGGEEVCLTRLEYSTLVFLASNPGIVLTRTQISFEMILSILVDTFFTRIFMPKQQHPGTRNISVV